MMNHVDHQLGCGRIATAVAPFGKTFDVMTQFIPCLLGVLSGIYTGGVFLATPPHITMQYVEFLARCVGKRYLILAEKPWASSLAEIQRLARLRVNSPLTVRFNDHYLAKHVVIWLLQQPLAFFLGGPMTAIKGHLFEKSGSVSPAMGVGVLRDLCIHLVTVVSRLFPSDQIQVSRVWAGQHNGWNFPLTESYVRLQGHVDTLDDRVSVSLAAAKDYPVADKVLILEGPEAKMYVDLTAGTADLVFPGGSQRRLYPDPHRPAKSELPYVNILRRLIDGDKSLGLDVHEAIKILRILDDAKKLMAPLYQYELGSYPCDPNE